VTEFQPGQSGDAFVGLEIYARAAGLARSGGLYKEDPDTGRLTFIKPGPKAVQSILGSPDLDVNDYEWI
jgi:hypothetical protein